MLAQFQKLGFRRWADEALNLSAKEFGVSGLLLNVKVIDAGAKRRVDVPDAEPECGGSCAGMRPKTSGIDFPSMSDNAQNFGRENIEWSSNWRLPRIGRKVCQDLVKSAPDKGFADATKIYILEFLITFRRSF